MFIKSSVTSKKYEKVVFEGKEVLQETKEIVSLYSPCHSNNKARESCIHINSGFCILRFTWGETEWDDFCCENQDRYEEGLEPISEEDRTLYIVNKYYCPTN